MTSSPCSSTALRLPAYTRANPKNWLISQRVQCRSDSKCRNQLAGSLDPVLIGRMIGSGQGMQGLDLQALMGQFQN